MFGYLVAYIIGPLVRRIVGLVLVVMVLAFAITVPARLWVRYVSPRPADATIIGLNIATLGVIVVIGLALWRRRRGSPRWSRESDHRTRRR